MLFILHFLLYLSNFSPVCLPLCAKVAHYVYQLQFHSEFKAAVWNSCRVTAEGGNCLIIGKLNAPGGRIVTRRHLRLISPLTPRVLGSPNGLVSTPAAARDVHQITRLNQPRNPVSTTLRLRNSHSATVASFYVNYYCLTRPLVYLGKVDFDAPVFTSRCVQSVLKAAVEVCLNVQRCQVAGVIFACVWSGLKRSRAPCVKVTPRMWDEISISSEQDEERCVFLCIYLHN